jgi:uncharacterized membrane protein
VSVSDDTTHRGLLDGEAPLGVDGASPCLPEDSFASAPELGEQHRRETGLNIIISRVLMIGLVAAVALLVVGVVVTLARPGIVVPRATSIRGIPRALWALEPGAFFEIGLLVLLATPAARVVALLLAYVRRRQWLFSAICVFVLAVLILSGYLGLAD